MWPVALEKMLWKPDLKGGRVRGGGARTGDGLGGSGRRLGRVGSGGRRLTIEGDIGGGR